MTQKKQLHLMKVPDLSTSSYFSANYLADTKSELQNIISDLDSTHVHAEAELIDEEDIGFDFLLNYDDDELNHVVQSA